LSRRLSNHKRVGSIRFNAQGIQTAKQITSLIKLANCIHCDCSTLGFHTGSPKDKYTPALSESAGRRGSGWERAAERGFLELIRK